MTDKPDLGALFGAPETSTFLGLQACDFRGAFSEKLSELGARIGLIGAPGATPYSAVGAYCRNGPDALRASIASMSANVERYNFDLGGPVFPEGIGQAVDCGNLPFDEDDPSTNRMYINFVVAVFLDNEMVPIVLGGDDSVPIPMLQAYETTGKSYTILQLDAHIDWRSEHMGERMGLSSTMRRASEMDHIERIIQVGARGIGSASVEDVQDALDWGVQFVSADALHKGGVDPVLAMIPEGAEVIVCLDVDALDPSIVPGVIGRAPGGLSYTQALDLIKGVAARGRIAGMDVVEYMPEVDVDGLGALTVSRLVAASMGVVARQE
jgi:agmatinase